jgi:hypothetical protein
VNAGGLGGHVDIEGFYSQDERRRASEEIELGTEWRDAGGNRYELSWVVDTGELYVMLEPIVGGFIEDPFGDVFDVGHARADQLTVAVVGWIPDRARVDEVLSGWGSEMGAENGITWLADRLKQAGVPRSAPAA